MATALVHSRRRFLMLGEPAFAPLSSQGFVRKARIDGKCLAERGIVCRGCSEHCGPLAIRFQLLPAGRSLPLIDDTRCNACGECVRVCPSQALSLRVLESASA